MLGSNSAAVRTIVGRQAATLLSYDWAVRAGIAAGLLLTGAMIYGVARPGGVHGPLAGAAPTFLHVIALTLLCSAATSAARGPARAWCAFWAAVNALFEIGQHPQVAPRLAAALESRCGWLSACESTARYFVHGTFDPFDLLAAACGGGAACLVLEATRRRSAP